MIEHQIDCVGTCSVGRRSIQTPALVRVKSQETRLSILAIIRTPEESALFDATMVQLRRQPTAVDLRIYRSYPKVPDLSGYARIESLALTTYVRGIRYEGRLPSSARELYLVGEHDVQSTGEIARQILATRDQAMSHLCVLSTTSQWSPSLFHAIGQSQFKSLDLNGFDDISESMLESLVSVRGLERLHLGIHTEQVLAEVARSRSLHDWSGRVSLVLRADVSAMEQAAKVSPIVRSALRSQRRRRRRSRLRGVP